MAEAFLPPSRPFSRTRSCGAAILLAGALAAGPAAADSDAPAWQGVYEGVIGEAHIVAALAPSGARYVYLGQANDLGLIVSGESGALRMVETLAPGVDEDGKLRRRRPERRLEGRAGRP